MQSNGKGTRGRGIQGHQLSRRKFLQTAVGAAAGAAALGTLGELNSLDLESAFASRTLVPTSQLINPLEEYPNRGWEKVNQDQYAYDSSFTWVCSPNDTHECRLRAFVKSGVVLRSEQNYDSGNITDINGNQATG